MRQVLCKWLVVFSPVRGGRVEAGHEFAVGGAGGGQVLVAFVELQPQVDGLLFQLGDALVERVDVGWVAEPSPDSRQACSPSASESRFSSWWMRVLSRWARSWAASRSACSEARVTAGPLR